MDDPVYCLIAVVVWLVAVILGMIKLASDSDPERNRH